MSENLYKITQKAKKKGNFMEIELKIQIELFEFEKIVDQILFEKGANIDFNLYEIVKIDHDKSDSFADVTIRRKK